MKKLAAIMMVLALAVTFVAYEPAPAAADASWDYSPTISKSCPYGQDVHLYGYARWNGERYTGDTYPLLTRKMTYWAWGYSSKTVTWTANKNVAKTSTWKFVMSVDTGHQSILSGSFSAEVYWWDSFNQVKIVAVCGS